MKCGVCGGSTFVYCHDEVVEPLQREERVYLSRRGRGYSAGEIVCEGCGLVVGVFIQLSRFQMVGTWFEDCVEAEEPRKLPRITWKRRLPGRPRKRRMTEDG